MGKSFKEYITSLGHWGWLVLVDIVGGAVGSFIDVSGKADIPIGIWLGALIIGLIIVPFIAFHKLRVQRDGLNTSLLKQEWEYVRPNLIKQREPYLTRISPILQDITQYVDDKTKQLINNITTCRNIDKISEYVQKETDIQANTMEGHKKFFIELSNVMEASDLGISAILREDAEWNSKNKMLIDCLSSDNDLENYIEDYKLVLIGNADYTIFWHCIEDEQKTSLRERSKYIGGQKGIKRILRHFLVRVNRRLEELLRGDEAT